MAPPGENRGLAAPRSFAPRPANRSLLGQAPASRRSSLSTRTSAQRGPSTPTLGPISIMRVSSSAFTPGGDIPATYTQDGQDCSPALTVTDVPPEARSLVLIVDDPDSTGGVFTHWLVFNIDPHVGVILDNSIPLGATEGTNDTGGLHYRGPKPPSGTHRYFFRVHALDRLMAMGEGANRAEIEAAMRGHVLASAQLMGRYTAPARAT